MFLASRRLVVSGTNFHRKLVPDTGESHEPWILFEAGAISKKMENARVIPYLYNLKQVNVTGGATHEQLHDTFRPWRVMQHFDRPTGV